MSTTEGRQTRGIFRRRWTKVCGALEKTAAELGLNPSDEEDVANALSMSPPKSAGRRGTRSPSPPKTPPAGTSSTPTPPRSASFGKQSTGTGQASTKMPPIGKVKEEPDVNNNAAVSEDPPDVSQLLPPKSSPQEVFCEFRQRRSFERWFDYHFPYLRLFAGSDWELHHLGSDGRAQAYRLRN